MRSLSIGAARRRPLFAASSVRAPTSTRRQLGLPCGTQCRGLFLLLSFFGALLLGILPAAPGIAQKQRADELLVEVRTGNVVLVAPERLAGEAERLARFAAEVLPRLQADLRQTLQAPTILALIDGRPQHPELRAMDAAAAPWAAGYMFGAQRIGGIRLHQTNNYPFDSTEMVLVHELSHQLIYDKVRGAVPTWFDEAVATREGRRRGARDLVVFTSLTLFGQIPRLAAVDRGFSGRSAGGARLAYATSFEFLTWAIDDHGPHLVGDVLDATARKLSQRPLPLDARTPFESAWQEVTGQPLLVAEERWRDRGLRLRRWIPMLMSTPWLWIGMALLAVVAALKQRRRTREQYRRWEAEELAAARPVSAQPLSAERRVPEDSHDPPLIN